MSKTTESFEEKKYKERSVGFGKKKKHFFSTAPPSSCLLSIYLPTWGGFEQTPFGGSWGGRSRQRAGERVTFGRLYSLAWGMM